MPTFTSSFLAASTGGVWTAEPTTAISGFTQDTRKIGAGQVFVALKTDKRDGHDFISVDKSAGAAAAIVAHANPAIDLPQLVVADPLRAFQAIAREHRRAFRGRVIGISGSAGKTSTKNLLATLLGDGSTVLATEGNLNNHIGVPLTLTRLDPDKHVYAVIEAGISEPGEMAPLASMIEPDIAIITLVAPAHLQSLGSIEGVAREKAILPGAVRSAGIAIFPETCLLHSAFRDLTVRKMIVEPAAVIRPTPPARDTVYFAISHRDEQTAVSLSYEGTSPLMFMMTRVSEGMAQNAALAICAALWLSVSATDIQSRLSHWRPANMRGELKREGDRWVYLDCYNANPAAMADALAHFYQIAPASEPRLFVIGGMEELGAESANYHRALGRMIHLRAADYCYLIGSEAEAVRAGALENRNHPDQLAVVTSLDPVMEHLQHFRGAIFVKGSRKYALEQILSLASEHSTRPSAKEPTSAC